MLFFKYTFEVKEAVAVSTNRKEHYEMAQKLADASEVYCDTLKGNASLFVTDIKRSKYTIAAIFRADALKSAQPKDIAARFMTEFIGAGSIKREEEITEKELLNLLRTADHRDYVADEDNLIESFELDIDFRCGRSIGEEIILSNGCSLTEARKRASRLCCSNTLIPELERIYASMPTHSFAGQPVLYTVSSTDAEHTKAISLFLLESLYKNRRLCSRRSAIIDALHFDNDRQFCGGWQKRTRWQICRLDGKHRKKQVYAGQGRRAVY